MGRLTSKKKELKIIEPKRKTVTYSERQKMKVIYRADSDRIRELNLLNKNESSFLRLLKQEFSEFEVIVKNKRMFIVDYDNYPIAIFEYRDGFKPLRSSDKEDGLPIFLYKGLISNDALKEDKQNLHNVKKLI